MPGPRIPVWLVTGYLGAGKTTLLARWLAEPALARAALVVNEVGEVGLDDRLLARAVDSAALVANACICCTGLPGLEQALADLWWDRLQRRRPAFDAVVIETTGLADPGPVVRALATDAFLQARYELAGVLVMASATTGWHALSRHPEALAQVRHAGLLVVTKADRADPAPLVDVLRAENPQAAVASSARASLGWEQVQRLIEAKATAHAAHAAHAAPGAPAVHGDHPDHGGAHPHPHGPQARFVPCPPGLDRAGLARWAEGQRGPGQQRLKGVLQSADGRLYMAQWCLGDETVSLVGFDGPVPRLGLTCIA